MFGGIACQEVDNGSAVVFGRVVLRENEAVAHFAEESVHGILLAAKEMDDGGACGYVFKVFARHLRDVGVAHREQDVCFLHGCVGGFDVHRAVVDYLFGTFLLKPQNVALAVASCIEMYSDVGSVLNGFRERIKAT